MAFIRNSDALVEGLSNKFFTNARAKSAVQSDLDSLSSSISSESSARQSAVSDLQGQIDHILSNIDPAALDSLTEIVAAFQSADSSINTAISNLSASSSAAVSAEQSRAEAAEASLSAAISQEVSDRQSAVSAEVSRAEAAEGVLTSAVSAEASRAEAAEASLSAGLAQEVSDRQAAVSAEASARATAVSAEASRAEAAEASLSAGLAQEVSDRQAAVSAEASARSAAVSAEASARATAVSAEASARATAVSAEASSRAAADSALSSRLDVIEGSGAGSILKAISDSESYTDSKIAALINGAPAALDTLKEIADQLANDESAVSALTNTVSLNLQAAKDYADGKVSTEQSRSQGIEAGLRSDLNSEIANRQSADSSEAAARAAEDLTMVKLDGSRSMTGVLKQIDGAVTAPSYSFASKTNSGMYLTASSVSISYNGTKRIEAYSLGAWVTGGMTLDGSSGCTLLWNTDGSGDIGSSGAKRPNNVYVKTSVVTPSITIGSLSGMLKASAGVVSGSATTSDLTEGSNLYYTQARFDSAFAAKSTTNLAEGTNLYYTTARVKADAVVNSSSGSQTDQAMSVSAAKSYVDSGLAQKVDVTANYDIKPSVYSAGTKSSNFTINLAQGAKQKFTLGASVTVTFSNPVTGGDYLFEIVQDATGGRQITWPTVQWFNGVAPTLSGANKTDFVQLFYDGSSYYGSYQLADVVFATSTDLSSQITSEASTRAAADTTLQTNINNLFSTKTTSNLAEGTNLYYTTARTQTDASKRDLSNLTTTAINQSLLFTADGTLDIGASAASRPNNVYVKTALNVAGLTVSLGAGSVSTNVAIGPSSLNSNTTGAANVAIGNLASQYAVASANVAIGSTALGGSATISATGGNATAIGTGAGQYVSTATSLVAVGIGALAGQSTTAMSGNNNTAVGALAGQFVSTAQNIVAIGANALKGITTAPVTGNSNVAIGSGAGQNVTSGLNNIAIGTGSLIGQATGPITGSSNVSIGVYASQFLTSASNNVAIGSGALQGQATVAVTGSTNTVVGISAAQYLSSGARNLAMGYQAYGGAVANPITGNDNVLLGYQAGKTLIGGSSNILIGSGIQASSGSASNEINIGGIYKADSTNGITLNADVVYSGGQKVKYAGKTADYTLVSSDYCVEYTSLASSKTVTLPSAATVGAGKVYVIKDGTGLASASNYIRVTASSPDTIDGSSYFDINAAYESVMVVSNGTNWIIL